MTDAPKTTIPDEIVERLSKALMEREFRNTKWEHCYAQDQWRELTRDMIEAALSGYTISKVSPAGEGKNKPCPFCGAKPILNRGKTHGCQLHGEPITGWALKCPHGCACIEASSREQCEERWNTRTIPEPDGFVLVPIEPTPAMLRAGLDEAGWRVEPHEPEKESGVEVECGITQEDADEINDQMEKAISDIYRAMLSASTGGEDGDR